MAILKILCIDDDPDFLVAVTLQLRDQYKVFSAETVGQGMEILKNNQIDMVLLDVNLGQDNGIANVRRIRGEYPYMDIVMISGIRDPRVVVEAMREGANDYLTKPFDLEDINAIVERQSRCRQVKERYGALVEAQNRLKWRGDIIFKSTSMRRLLDQADQLKGHQANVLIAGETGTGKELLARYIHRLEGDDSRPFVAVNCAAIPEPLLEAELFGSELGAYTGAIKRRIGKFELADGGDIFLDEISALKLDLQAKILRILQEREFCRLGGNDVISANFRVIAATNELLEQKVGQGEFRMDLYHRIRVIQLCVPPLRERSEDIPALVDHYLTKFSRDGAAKKILPEALARLMSYRWPGNIRELANVVHGLTILSPGDTIDESAFPPWAMNGCGATRPVLTESPPPMDVAVVALKEYVLRAERQCIQHALKTCSGDKSKAARLLQMGRTTLYSKMKELGIWNSVA